MVFCSQYLSRFALCLRHQNHHQNIIHRIRFLDQYQAYYLHMASSLKLDYHWSPLSFLTVFHQILYHIWQSSIWCYYINMQNKRCISQMLDISKQFRYTINTDDVFVKITRLKGLQCSRFEPVNIFYLERGRPDLTLMVS